MHDVLLEGQLVLFEGGHVFSNRRTLARIRRTARSMHSTFLAILRVDFSVQIKAKVFLHLYLGNLRVVRVFINLNLGLSKQ